MARTHHRFNFQRLAREGEILNVKPRGAQLLLGWRVQPVSKPSASVPATPRRVNVECAQVRIADALDELVYSLVIHWLRKPSVSAGVKDQVPLPLCQRRGHGNDRDLLLRRTRKCQEFVARRRVRRFCELNLAYSLRRLNSVHQWRPDVHKYTMRGEFAIRKHIHNFHASVALLDGMSITLRPFGERVAARIIILEEA